jgi:hypothetical protein
MDGKTIKSVMKKIAVLFLPLIFQQGCTLAGQVAATVAEKGYDYSRDGTVIDVMNCPMELCMEYGRSALRGLNIPYREEKKETHWLLLGSIPEREAEIRFYPLSGNLTKVKAKVYLVSNQLDVDRDIAMEILDRMNIVIGQ